MPRFSKNVIGRLREAGWRPNRRIDTSSFESDYEALGYGPFQSLSAGPLVFLREFGDLALRHGNRESFHFRVVRRTHEQCSAYRSITGEEVWPVGLLRDAYFDVLIAADSRVYAGGETGVYLLGQNIDEAVEFACSRALKSWTLPEI